MNAAPEAKHLATPAPLDPFRVKAGDTVTLVGTKAKIEGEVEDVQKDTPDLVIIQIDNLRFRMTGDDAWTLTAHQSAPEPEPEWEPGTTGRATLNDLVSGASSLGMRAMRVIDERGAGSFIFENGKWIRDDATTWSVSDFVPDEPRPTREALTEALRETAQERETRSSWAEDADLILAALQRGES